MIDTKELRRLAQAATPGPWIAKNVSGAGLEIHMSHPVYPDKEWPAFGTDSAFCKKGLVSYETWTQFPHDVRDAQQSINAEYIAASNPATILELLDRLEAAEKERDELRSKIAEMEKQEPARLVTATAYRWRYRGAIKWQYGELTEETARLAKEHNHEVQPLGILPGAKGE